MRRVLLFFAMHVIAITIIEMLTKIAYNQSIYDTWWVAGTYIIVCWIFAEIVSEKVTRK